LESLKSFGFRVSGFGFLVSGLASLSSLRSVEEFRVKVALSPLALSPLNFLD
jgi:hypothetical protein